MKTSVKFGRYADVLVDTAFKYVLGQNEKKPLISLLKTFLDLDNIEDIDYIPTEDVGTGPEDKVIRYDITCKTSDNRRIIVEAQIVEQQYFNYRAMLYVSAMVKQSALEAQKKLDAENEKRQEEGKSKIVWNYAFSPVYLLVIFKKSDRAEHSTKDCVHTYRMRDVKNGDLLGPDVSITFVELGKYERDNGEDSTEQQWLYTLKHLPVLEERPDWINDNDIMKVYDRAEFANMPPDVKQFYEYKMTTELDFLNAIETAKQDAEEWKKTARAEGLAEGRAKGLAEGRAKGLAEGRAKGLAEGKAEGKAERNMEIAKALKEKGVETSIICQTTGLTEAQIKEL